MYDSLQYTLVFPPKVQAALLAQEDVCGVPTIRFSSQQETENAEQHNFAVGTEFVSLETNEVLLRIEGLAFFPRNKEKQILAYVIHNNVPLQGSHKAFARKKNFQAAVITLSDKASIGKRIDESGPLIKQLLEQHVPELYVRNFILPDNPFLLRGMVANLALQQKYDLIVTTGGTGVSPRDTSPEAIAPLLTRELPGFCQAMMAVSLSKTPLAILSRSIAGVIGTCLIFTLPGSKKAVAENISAVLPALHHALLKLHGDTQDCAILHLS